MTTTATTREAEVARPAEPLNARTRLLLEGAVFGTLIRLAVPNFGEAAARIAFIAFDAIFVGWIGTDALAGVSLAFPIFLLMQTMSAGGIGSGVAGAIGTAMGAGRVADAERVAAHAVLLALAIATFAGAVLLGFGPTIYRALGAEGATLDAALTYSNLVFGGVVAVWLMNLLANVVRGTGIMTVPAAAIVIGEAAHLSLSPALILGLGPFPALGVTGAALAVLSAYVVGAAILLGYLVSGRGVIRLRAAAFRPAVAHFGTILKVGVLASLNLIQLQATFLGLTSLFAVFGPAALAGFGAANRLELLQIPITFGVGSAVITMVATNIGAGRRDRAQRIAWAGCTVSVGIGAVFATIAMLWAESWMALFSSDAAVIAAGATYLNAMGPALPILGFGLGLLFALLGAGTALWPFLAGTARLVIAVVGGWLVVHGHDGGLGGLALASGLAAIAFTVGVVICGRSLLAGKSAATPARE